MYSEAYQRQKGKIPADDHLSYRRAIDVARREAITRALAQSGGNHTAAARAIGIHKTHLLKLMKVLRID